MPSRKRTKNIQIDEDDATIAKRTRYSLSKSKPQLPKPHIDDDTRSDSDDSDDSDGSNDSDDTYDSDFVVSDDSESKEILRKIFKKKKGEDVDENAAQIKKQLTTLGGIELNKIDPIINEIESGHVSYSDILRSELNLFDKARLAELKNALEQIDVGTIEYVELKKTIHDDFARLNMLGAHEHKFLADCKSGDAMQDNKIIKSIIDSKLERDTKQLLIAKYNATLTSDAEERTKNMLWIQAVLKIPFATQDFWMTHGDYSANIISAKCQLDQQIYGMEKAKIRVLELFTSMITNPTYSRKCIALVGSPGIGKSLFSQTVAKVMKFPCEQISLGGMNDSACLLGHHATYVSAKSGAVVNAVTKMGCTNGVIIFDEFDKLQSEGRGYEVIASLLHVLDYTQNSNFRDNYIHEVPIDLSNIMFVLTLNDIACVDKILLDRIHVIRMEDYTMSDKIDIGIKYIFPRLIQRIGIAEDSIICPPHCMTQIIAKTSDEKGVRNLERNIQIIIERLNVIDTINRSTHNVSHTIKNIYKYYIPAITFPVVLTDNIIDVLIFEHTPREAYQSMYV